MGEIKVGTCGYSYYSPPEGWKEEYGSKLQAYSEVFNVGEINRTFYKLPMVSTTERWRREASENFEFTMKAWQALTHPTSSPTWRNSKERLTNGQEESFGYLRPNGEVEEAWIETKKRVEAMDAKVCLIQTPPSFDCSEGNEKNMRDLLGRIDRGKIKLAWEPRGDWKENLDRVKSICEDLGLIHVVDLMWREPVSSHGIAYIRLHGLNSDEYDYDYKYSKDELKELTCRLKDISTNHDAVYCMFNNYEMYDDARRLIDLL